jgi:hypothetical protein
VSGGTFRTHSGLRAVINAWLEDISFRTGMITGAVVLLVIAAGAVAVTVLGHGGQAAGALGSRGPATVAPSAAASPVSTAQPPVMPGSATPARSAPAASAPPPRSAAAVSAPAGGSPSAAPATGSGPVAAASGAGREGYGLASPAGWRHGTRLGWGERGWTWGPYRGGTYVRGSWW